MTIDEPHDPWLAPRRAAAGPRARRGRPLGHRHRLAAVRSRPARASDVDFTIIQVTSGRPGTVSPCLTEQVAWARSVRSVVNAYVVPGSPSAADLAAAARGGSCRGERSCRLRAAGAADAADALAGAEAAGLDARGWWLDVEDVAARTLWGTDTDANTQVLIGWRDELRRGRQAGRGRTPRAATGDQIVGHWKADLPQWAAVGLAGVNRAAAACERPFTSGPVLMTQWLTGPLDGNLLCPGQDRLAGTFFGPFSPGPHRRRARPADHPGAPPRHRGRPAGPRPRSRHEQASEDQQDKAAAAAGGKAKAQRAKERPGTTADSATGPSPPPDATPSTPPPPAPPRRRTGTDRTSHARAHAHDRQAPRRTR